MSGTHENLISDINWSDDSFSDDSSRNKTETWRGVPMIEIYNGSDPWVAPEPLLITPAYNHAVLFYISPTGFGNQQSRKEAPTPQRGNDRWDKDHVRLPHSPQNLYPVKKADGSTELQPRWDLIKKALLKPIRNSEDLENAILSYNTKYETWWKFHALHKLFNEHLEEEEYSHFFSVTLPGMIQLALSLPDLIQSSIPLLRQHHNRSISLSQQQIASLLANAFFCTFPRRNSRKPNSEYSSYPKINFYRLFMSNGNSVIEKLKCIFHYFRRVCTSSLCGVLTFTRRTVEPEKCPDWGNMQDPIGRTLFCINSKGIIEDEGAGLLQVDFANKFLGGGVLNRGCVQEEIRFVICPELLVSMLFTEYLMPTEALIMIGCERFSNYSGYANNFTWSGNYEDGTPYDLSGRRKCVVVAIDATSFNRSSNQYKPEFIKRELNKAWVGFSPVLSNQPQGSLHILPGVATGNWGCGAFGGSPYLKALLQIMACTAARRPIVYYTFGDEELRDNVINMYNFIAQNNITIGELYKCLISYHKYSTTNEKLYPFILQYRNDKIPKKIKIPWKSRNDQADSCNNGKFNDNVCSEAMSISSEELSINDPCNSFIDLEQGIKHVGEAQLDTEEVKPSTSFFDEFSQLEEMKGKSARKKSHNHEDATENEVVDEASENKETTKNTVNDGNNSPKRALKKISDYFVRLKK